MYQFNPYQTQLTEELLDSLHQEVKEELLDVIENVEYVKRLISKDRLYAKDLPKDDDGKIIIDICNPHILTDMDYFRPVALHFQKHGTVTNLRPNANPNSEFGKWIAQERDRIWYGMVRSSDGEWIPGTMYYYLNYMPIIQTLVKKDKKGNITADRVVDFPKVWEGVYLWYHYLHQSRYGGIYNDWKGQQHGVQIAKRGASKAHSYDTKVYTPEGIKLWRDIKIGDLLWGPNNQITQVIGIPFEAIRPVYEFTLADGRKIKSSEDHWWKVQWRGKEKIMSTFDISQKYFQIREKTDRIPSGIEYLCRIPKNEGIEFPSQEIPIDSYTFGLLLGDGTFRGKWKDSIYYTSCEEDMITYKSLIPYQIDKWASQQAYAIRIKNAKLILSNLGLYMKKSEGKFIPNIYKYNTREIRKNILAGLLDSDGHVDNRGLPIFNSVSKQLAEDVAELCRSLGYNCSIKQNPAGYKDKNGEHKQTLDCYSVRIYTDEKLFKLERKNSKIKKRTSKYSRSKLDYTTIIDINLLDKEPVKCVTVDNESHEYLIGDFITTHNSYTSAAMIARMFILGENENTWSHTRSIVTAYDKEKLTKDGILNKFVDAIDFAAEYTQFPSARLKNALDDMHWVMGYKDPSTGVNKGIQNEVLGVAANDNPDKARGKRGNLGIYEEFGAFKKFLDTWNVNRRSFQEGNIAFGQMIAIGTGGSEGSNFYGALEMIYAPEGYNVYALPNYYDKSSRGKQKTVYFFPAYINRAMFYNKDGVSDVIGALIEILEERVRIKYSASDPLSLTRAKAEDPITIQEAIMKRESTIYPVGELTERVNYLDQNPKIYNEIYTGILTLDGGEVKYKPSAEVRPVREFPHKDNSLEGCIEIHSMPIKNDGNRYIAGIDPYDDDASGTLSLGAAYILDLVTDQIVAEYVGRPMFADDFYENCRKLLLFYNAKANYENNKKGLYTYFSKMNCSYLLTDTLDYLRDKDVISRTSLYGNKAKGTVATKYVNSYYRLRIRDWLLKPYTVTQFIDGEEVDNTIPMLQTLQSRALLKELIMWTPDGNFDRHDALGMLMLLREDRLRLLGERSTNSLTNNDDNNYLGDDPFFQNNYKKERNTFVGVNPNYAKQLFNK